MKFFKIVKKKIFFSFFQIFFFFNVKVRLITLKYVKQVNKYKILPSMCLEANGSILETCSVWALA